MAQDEQELWERFAEHGDIHARNALIAHFSPFAEHLAGRLYARRHVQELEYQDFRQFALLGLIEAIERFQLGRGASFKTYAGYRIRGAVLDGVERLCERQQQINARGRVKAERVVSLTEGEDEIGDPFAELAEIAIGLAIGFMLEDTGLFEPPSERRIADSAYRAREVEDLRRFLRTAVECLAAQEQQVVRKHYFLAIPFEQIAKELGVTKGRVSQIHRQALRSLASLQSELRLLDTRY